MWGDCRFRNLSPPQPCGKYLWIFLLTGPQTSNIPGLFRAGEMALAEELGWSVEGFRKAFAEPFQEGLVKADWKARVVWIPNAIKYNPPDNPNVVKSWRTAWDEIPECLLKVDAYERLKAFTEGLGEGFGKAFTEGCAKGLANQELEQEQEQEQEEPSDAGAPVAEPRHLPIRHLIQELHLQKFKVKCQWDGSEGKALGRLLDANPSWTMEQIAEMVRNRFSSDGVTAGRPRSWLPRLFHNR